MKTFLIASIALVASFVGAQTPPPQAPTPPVPPPSATPAASATVSATASPESSLEQSIRKKHKDHFSFVIGDSDEDKTTAKHRNHGDDDIPAMVVPLVGIIVLTVFGAPVLIVAVIMYFGFSKGRLQHRTIRMLVEKGQPVPPELLAPPAPAVRQRSDMRRGVVLLMVGIGLVVFFGAVNDWENGAWAIGIIPFLIGAGYLMVWKLEGGKTRPDNPPPLP